MEIRLMNETDLPRVVILAGELGYEVSPEDAAHRFGRLGGHLDYAFFVALQDEEVVGWIQVNRDTEALLLRPRADIAALVVDQRYRSSGIGKLLLKQSEAWALERGLTVLRVRSSTWREAAHRFYLREGYDLLKTGHIFQKVLVP